MTGKAGREMGYNCKDAVEYAHKWALGRNPGYYDFDNVGGDCTSFASQVIYAGSKVMNYTPVYGWYYKDSFDRTASWTSVMHLYDFLVNNKGLGPYGEKTELSGIMPGDIIQLSFEGNGIYNHTPVVVSVGSQQKLDNIRVAAHTHDRDNYPVTNYSWADIRFVHIIGVRS